MLARPLHCDRSRCLAVTQTPKESVEIIDELEFMRTSYLTVCMGVVLSAAGAWLLPNHTILQASSDVLTDASSKEAENNSDGWLPNLLVQLPSGDAWRASSYVGQRSLQVLVVGVTAQFDEALLSSASVRRACQGVEEADITPVMIMAKPLRQDVKDVDAVFLYDKAGANQKLLAVQPNEVRSLVIDKAGFVRSNEIIIKPEALGAKDWAALVLRSKKELPVLSENQPAPDFAMRDMNGQVRRLSDLRGKKNVLLTFFPKCFTGHCATHLSSLRDAYPALQKQDTEVWGVSIDPAGGERGQVAFAKFLKLPFPLIPDVGRNLCILYGAVNSPNQMAIRMSVFIDKQGAVRWIDKQIEIKTHGQDVVEKWMRMQVQETNLPKDK